MLALGVSEETIEKDYLLTNKYRHNLIVKKHKAYRLLGHFSKNMRTLLTFSREGFFLMGAILSLKRLKVTTILMKSTSWMIMVYHLRISQNYVIIT